MPTGLGFVLEAEGVGGGWILLGQWPVGASVSSFGRFPGSKVSPTPDGQWFGGPGL